jgi:hypothetical protein
MRNAMSRRVLGAVFGSVIAVWSAAALAQQKPVTLEYFSWSIFRLTAPSGEVILTNPFVTNPDSPVKVADFPKVDAIVVADGHRDEVGSSDEIALATGAKIITTYEMYNIWFQPRNVPLPQVLRSEQGDSNMIGSVKIRNVTSVHGSGTADKADGGQAMGFFISFDNGFTVYFAGSSDTSSTCRCGARSSSRTSLSCACPTVAIRRISSSRRGCCAPVIPTSRRSSPITSACSRHRVRITPLTSRRPSRARACRSR